MKIYLIAGEPSGDALGARLMKALRFETKDDVEFFGLGGQNMEEEGLKPLFDIADLAVMGLWEVVPSIPRVLRRIEEVLEDIKRVKPDVIVSIDSWSFCSRVHKKLKILGLGVPQVHYVAPQVWAWKKKRARTMYRYIDLLLTLLPQEPKYFTPYGLKTVFVGHPVIETDLKNGNAPRFKMKFEVEDGKKIVGILPGSRHNEVAKLLPVFIGTAQKMMKEEPNCLFVLPTVRTVEDRVRGMMAGSGLPFVIVDELQDRPDAYKALDVAMAASGTVSLELAITNVAHIIAYKVSPITAFLARKFLKIQFVNLVNILLGREVVPELIQERATDGNIKRYMFDLLKKGELYEREMAGFVKVAEILGVDEQKPSERAAKEIVNIANENMGCAKGVECVYS